MANIMSQVKFRNHTSRDAFDLSHRNVFTAKVGELLPECCIEMIPGDSFDMAIEHFTRTQPVNTAAYTRMREYHDWFFVPTELLWNKFNSFVTQMVDNNQHATGINSRQVLTDTHPYFTTNQLHTHIRRLADAQHKNIFGYDSAMCSCKLLEYLDYGSFTNSAIPNGPAFSTVFRTNANLNPFPLLAYQKIYQDYYRNSQWENAYAPAFNIDYITGAISTLNIPVSDISLTSGFEDMFTLRYANWHKDLFMGLLPNSQYGAASIVDTGSGSGSLTLNLGDTTGFSSTFYMSPSSTDAVGSNLVIGAESSNYSGKYIVKAGQYSTNFYFPPQQIQNLRSSLGLTSSNTSVDIATSFSILALRQAEALQKWREITQSQQQDYKNQVEAHFGVSPDNGYSDRCTWIDGSVSNLDISEVTNSNITGSNAADIAGKGVGVGRGKSKFKTNVHGYLLCIYHCEPMLDYQISGVTRHNLKTKVTDYAIPEFDRTGMVSVPMIELTNAAGTETFDSNLLGYAPRYYDYKQKVDLIHGAFASGGLGSWVAPFTALYIKSYFSGSRRTPLTYTFFKINPSILNPIFTVDATAEYSTDQLLLNVGFDIKAVRNLDRDGLPY